MILLSRDAWAKHKDMELYEAKWLYVEALLKVSTTIFSFVTIVYLI